MSVATETRPLADRLRHLRAPLAVSGVLLFVTPAVGWWVDGPTGALGAAVGVLVVAGGYALSSVTVAWADWINPKLVFSVGLASYLFKVSLLGIVLMSVLRADWPGTRMMAIGMITAILAWVFAQTWWTAMYGPTRPDPAVERP
ncbi:hypothetical protein [Actinoplanes derwentensis]|uniref:ATP synthase protein I n=1 Tax=Actinoplanes derwentensis TaxID=113562 RepID=A0A1H2D3D0_9ACTN|nr:hypothetical protein [Actinoplanes derwentensis]GID85934.1 hypothetical protein Ade03nite_48580 [Actinoplanes derwentensis]SDT77261.1 hypothetical protein SAMN04489716_7887 [Actinoplanes derwentensis]